MHCKPHHRLLLAVTAVSLVATGACDKLKARDQLNKGVEAYKAAHFDSAIEHFKNAKTLDPSLTSARLFLATAYGSQYIPAVPTEENNRNGLQAIEEYKEVLQADPNNLNAIDGIGGMLYNMGSNPFDLKMLEESKSYHQKHIDLKPDDPEPYYWIGVIDYWHAYRDNHTVREEYNKTAKKTLSELDPLPSKIATQFAGQDGSIVEEGMTNLKKAIELRSDYDDAMAYLNLLYRQKADMETDAAARDTDTRMANDLVDKVKVIKQQRMQNPAPAPAS